MIEPDVKMALIGQVTGEPYPEIQWFRDGNRVDPIRYPRYEIVSIEPRHSLTIRSISEADDEAKITCEATNLAGKVTTFTRILVVTDARVAEADAIFRQ